MSLPYGTYLVFGQRLPFDAAPQVHLLGPNEQASFQDRIALGRTLRDADAATRAAFSIAFGMPNADTALPAWSRDAMVMIAEGYKGPHETAVKGLAAAIALGRPFSQDTPPNDPGEGGTKVRPKGPKPNAPAPVSAFDSLLTGA